LRNQYDDAGRVICQDHGGGYFGFEYDPIGVAEAGYPLHRTKVRQKNGARLVVKHDAGGRPHQQTLYVSATSLSPEDRQGLTGSGIPLTTTSTFNAQGELIERTYPTEGKTEWVYDAQQDNPRARGNLLKVTHLPSPHETSDQARVVTQCASRPGS
jgi:hypothetical protein